MLKIPKMFWIVLLSAFILGGAYYLYQHGASNSPKTSSRTPTVEGEWTIK